MISDMSVREIQNDLRQFVEPDGSNAEEIVHDLAIEYGHTVAEVRAIWNEMNKL